MSLRVPKGQSNPFLFILIAGCFCLLFIHYLQAKSAPAPELSVFFDKNEYQAGEPIYINFKIKNKSDQPIYINKRFYINSANASPEDKEVFLRVTDPSGEQLPCQADYDTGFPKTDYFALLEPEDEITSERKRNLKAYFDLNDPSDQLSDAIRIIHKGDIWLPRDKMSSIMDRIISVVGRDLKEKTLDQLTPTEFQVLRLIGQGKSNDEIAESLFISKNTVRSHIKSIYAKLNTHSRLQLALYAINSALF